MSEQQAPYIPFRFRVQFTEVMLGLAPGEEVELCSGSFSECTGLDATMEPKVIKEGGRNWGVAQRAGRVSFSTVILKRGITSNAHLWTWFDFVGNGSYSHRMNAVVTMFDTAGQGVMTWRLKNAMPIKFKTSDLNAKATDVAVEEIHIAHEGLTRADASSESLMDSA